MKITPLSRDPEGIGTRILQARVNKNITLRQLSELSGINAMKISAIETGKLKGFSLHDLDRVRKSLGLSLSGVMDGKEDKASKQLKKFRQNKEAAMPEGTKKRRCRICGCTDDDCRQCIEKTGEPCYWVEMDLCSACAEELAAEVGVYR